MWRRAAAGLSVGVVGMFAAGCGADTPPAAPPRPATIVDVLGDSYSGGSDQGGVGPRGWPALIAGHFGWKVNDRSEGGSGYTTALPRSTTFPQRTAIVVGDHPHVVIVWASRNDIAIRSPAVIAAGERATLAALRRGLPRAQLVVVGPVWTSARVPASFMVARNAERHVASTFGAVFVDPLAEGWFAGRFAVLIGSDGVHPTDAGHARIAGLIEADLAAEGVVGHLVAR